MAGMESLIAQFARADANPWTAADAVEAAQLAENSRTQPQSERPTILYVGFRTLFEGGHIAGAVPRHRLDRARPGRSEKMGRYAASRRRISSSIAVAARSDHCPNIRPAFVALHGMGFTHLRVLVMPNNFASDWVDKGYPWKRESSDSSRSIREKPSAHLITKSRLIV